MIYKRYIHKNQRFLMTILGDKGLKNLRLKVGREIIKMKIQNISWCVNVNLTDNNNYKN